MKFVHIFVGCSNRTFMELKWDTDYRKTSETNGSNRTFMELKSEFIENSTLHISSSNRTFMELKYK